MTRSAKTAIVTGAAGTIGSAIVDALVARGVEVLAIDRDETALGKLAAEHVHTHVADVTDEESVRAYAAAANERWGRVDMFANNAGIEGAVAPVTAYDTAEFDRVQSVNVRGVFLGLKHVLPLIPAGGAVVNTSSGLGQVGAAGLGAYVASKHAVIGLTKSAALEQAETNVRVNAVCPGPIAGRMIEALEDATFGDSGTTMANFVPLGRHGKASEVANLVVFLLSDEASYISGTAHVVDGAFTAA